MSASVARRVTRAGAGVLVAVVTVVGLGTGALLHERQVRAIDRTLLAAAHGHAHLALADDDDEVEAFVHGRAPVEAWWVGPADARVPDALRREALDARAPLWRDLGDERVVLVGVEADTEHHGALRTVVAARLPRATLARTVGTFAAAYASFAAAAVALAVLRLRRVVRDAFAPIAGACAEAEQVVALGEGRRLTEDGPDEVRALLLAVNRLLDRLDASHAAQTRFTAEAAHELRTPVTTMLGELDVTLRHPRGADDYRAALVSQREEVERLVRLVGGLTALTQLDTGVVEQRRELVRAGELAREALAAERATLDTAACPVRLDVESDPELEAHRPLLVAALGNLLRNAARHAPGAPVQLRVGVDGDLVVFEVDDGGGGVPEAEREAVFGRFVRGGEARRRDEGGLGLGLPLAREVARRHGGDCTIGVAPGGGARVRLTARRLP